MKDRQLPFSKRLPRRLEVLMPHLFLLFLLGVMTAGFLGFKAPHEAEATVPKLIYYQGKISKTSDGTNIADGNYSMQFKIYSASSGGSLLWTETWDGGTSQVAFKNGLFSVALGTYTSLDTIDFSSGALYLTANFNPGAGYDGEMSPRQQLTSAAFAISANNVIGDGRIDIAYAPSTTTSPAGKIAYSPSVSSSNNALQVTAGSNVTGAAFNVVQSGTGGAILIGSTALNGSTQTYLGANPGSFSGNFIDFQIANTSKFSVTNAGNVSAAGTINGLTLSSTAVTATGALSLTAGGTATNVTLTTGTTGVVTHASSTSGSDTIQIKPQSSVTTNAFNGIITSADITTSDKTWTFPNVSGNVITSGDTATVTNTMLAGSIAASKLVGSDITTVGTIATGTWQGTAINAPYINFNSTNLQNSSNALNTIQNINTTANPQFGGLGIGTTGAAGKVVQQPSTFTTNGDIAFSQVLAFGNSTAGQTYYGYKLAITNSQTTNADTLYGQYISFTDAGSLANSVTGLYVDATTANSADTTYAAIFQGGNVGIGTATPSRKLDVFDASNPQLRLTYSTNTFYTDLQTTSSGYLGIIPSANRVGINTSAPGVLLHASSPTVAAGPVGTEELFRISKPLSGGTSYEQAAGFALGSYNATHTGFAPNTRLDINLKNTASDDTTPNVTVMTLLDNGSVGIGTNNPTSYSTDAQLVVQGASGASNGLYLGADLAQQSAIKFYDGTNGLDGLIYRPASSRNLAMGFAGGSTMTFLQASNVIQVGGGSSQTALRFMEASANGTDFVGIQAPAAVNAGGYTWTLPAADASGCLQSNGSGTISISSCGGSANITIGSTAISGGTTGNILYHNGTVVGEMTTTGSGTVVVLGTSPTITSPSFTTSATLNAGANLVMTSGTGTFTQSHAVTTDATADAMTLNLSAGGTGSTGVLRGLVINQADTATTGVYDSLAYILNQKTPETTTNGLFIENNASLGTMTNGLNITNTAGTLTNGLSFSGTMSAAIKFNNASDLDILDNSTTALTITEAANQYLLINTDNTNTVVTLDTPVAGVTTTTLNLGTAAVAKTINIGSTSDSALKLKKFTTANGLLFVSASDGTVSETAASTGAQCLQTASAGVAPTWGSCGAGGARLDQVSAATTTASIDSNANAITWAWNTLAGGNGLTLSSSSTAAASNTQTLLNVALSGTNATGSQTTYAAKFSNTHGGSGTNIGLYSTATSGSTNIAAFFDQGKVLIGTDTGSPHVLNLASLQVIKQGVGGDTDSTLAMQNTLSSGFEGMDLYDSSGSWAGSIAYGNSASSQANTMYLQTASSTSPILFLNNSTERLRIDSKSLKLNDVNGLTVEGIDTSTGTGTHNLIYNGSFEQNIHNWVAKGTPTGGTPVWDNTSGNAKYGSGTLKFSGDAAGDGAQYSFPFAASTTYSVSFWAKTASGTATMRLDRQDNGSDVGGCTDSAVTTTWTQFTCTFTTGATINTSTSNIFIKQNAAGTPTVYIDGFTLTGGSTPLSYTLPGSNINVDADYSNITLNANQDADIQPWQLNSTGLPTGRRGASTITANGFIYYIGGTTANGTSGAPVTTVNYARINGDGSLTAGSWLSTTVLPVALYGHASISANGYLYVIGGCSDSSATAACTTPVSTVYYSKLNSDGTLGTWQTSTTSNSLPAARGYGAAVFSNGFLYYLGGYNASAQTTVYSARLNADGMVSGWTTTGVTALGTGRYGLTTMNVNGKIYSIGGCSDAGGLCNTALATVEYASPANDGTLGAWTAATSLPTATGFHATGIVNGYLFNMGGRQGGSPVSTVYYAKVNSVGPLGAWTTSSYALPAVRQQATSMYVNTYLYNVGGFDGTTTIPTTAYFASGARVSIFGGLDLLGLTSQTLTDYSGAGTLTAGNTRVVGDLRIDGFADLNNGLSVDSVINLNAVSATLGQTVFNVNNSLSNSIFSVRHMNPTIGSLVTAGVVVQNMANAREEFSASKAGVTTAGSTAAFGDSGKWYVNNSATTVTTGLTTSNPNGYIRIAPGATSGIGGEVAFGATAGTLDKIFTPNNNLPIVQMKVRPSVMAATDDFVWGMFDQATAPTTNDTLPANGIFFWSNNGTGTTGWTGVVRLASANLGTVTCPGSATANKWATGRIEVMSNSGSNTVVHFMIDNDSSDGVNMIDCGTVTTASIWTAATTLGYGMYDVHTVASATTFDMDYASWWQDDNTDAPVDASATEPTTGTTDAVDIADQVATTPATDINIPVDDTGAKTTTIAGLVVDSIGALGDSIRFLSDTTFIGRPYFNTDTAGFAVVQPGDDRVEVNFDDEYLDQPIVSVSISLEANPVEAKAKDVDLSILKKAEEDQAKEVLAQGVSYVIMEKSTTGFTILLNKPATSELKFSWIALAVKNAKISLSGHKPAEEAPVVEQTTSNSNESTDAAVPTDSTPSVDTAPVQTTDSSTQSSPVNSSTEEVAPPPAE